MAAMNQLETKLDDIFEKNAPKIPANIRKMLADWAPWLALIGGIFTLWSAYALWSWANVASGLLDYANTLCQTYAGPGCNSIATSRMGLTVWLALAVLVVEGILYLLAFPGLRARKKAGWNYLYWGVLVNLAYGLVSLFTGYGVGTLIGSLIGSAIALWLLFQMRSEYHAAK